MCRKQSKVRVGKRIGLKFGFHGWFATSSLVATLYSIASNKHVWLPVVMNTIVAVHASSLLSQAPTSTKVFNGVIAPHREAFRRTMAIMHYASLRITGQRNWGGIFNPRSSILYHVLLGFVWWKFVPLKVDIANGNTWIFVIPMFLAVTGDVVYHEMQQNLCSEPDIASSIHMLTLHSVALILSFGFTLAFRGYLSIQKIYLFSAFSVATLFITGVYRLFTSGRFGLCSRPDDANNF